MPSEQLFGKQLVSHRPFGTSSHRTHASYKAQYLWRYLRFMSCFRARRSRAIVSRANFTIFAHRHMRLDWFLASRRPENPVTLAPGKPTFINSSPQPAAKSSASCKRGSAPASDQLRSRRERLQPIPLHCRHRPYRHPAIQLPFRAISKRTARLNPPMPPHSMQRYLIRLEPVNKKLKPNLSPRSRLNRRPLPLILHNMQAIDVTQCRRQLNQKSCKEPHPLRALSPRG